jgi:hypothetical protein
MRRHARDEWNSNEEVKDRKTLMGDGNSAQDARAAPGRPLHHTQHIPVPDATMRSSLVFTRERIRIA